MKSFFIRTLLIVGKSGLFLFLISCADDNAFVADRPLIVPETAEFFGGYDGWIWVDCEVESFDKLICKIYDRDGSLDRTSLLRPCLNLLPKYSQIRRRLSDIQDSVFFFDNVSFYEYRPATYPHNEPNGNELADKYYGLLGVGSECQSKGAELKGY